MKKFYGALIFMCLAAFAFSMSGCGGSSRSFSGNSYTGTETVKQIAVLTSPAFEIGKEYQIYRGSSLSGMKGAQYYIADVGSESNKATLNLGFTDELSNDTLVFVNNGRVVFAYDPSGTDSSALTEGTVTRTGGNLLSYNGLTIASAAFFTALDIDTSNAKTIILNGTSATYEGTAVPEYNYVWHSDPNHSDEYYTDGIDGITEYTKKQINAFVSADEVYIAHDIIYMPSGLEYTATVKNDDETEYAAYYSPTVSASVAAELTAISGDAFGGPYIFATLPGGTGTPGGNPGGGDFGPGSGDARPGMPSGDRTPPNMRASSYNDTISSTIALMTHSSADAYANPVLHITKAGTYSLQGTWNGQIWIDVGEESGDVIAVILNSADVTCTVAPAIVFHDLYECGPDDEETAAASSMDIGKDTLDTAGAMVVIADDTVNNFTGANVYRMLKPQPKNAKTTAINGTDVSQQKKRCKMDGAFYSFVSLAIGGGEKANGVLNIQSTTYEGLNTEMHATIESGTVNITALDDAINVNEDYVSVFTMLGGNMTISSTNGDGIDSNGYVVLLGGSLDITAGSQSTAPAGEGGIDYESGLYIDPSVHYTHHSANGGGGGITPPDSSPDVSPDMPVPPVSPDVSPDLSPDISPDVPVEPTSPDVSPDLSPDVSPDVPVTPAPTSPDTPVIPAPLPPAPEPASQDTPLPGPASPDSPVPLPAPASPDSPVPLPAPASPDSPAPVLSPDVPVEHPTTPPAPAEPDVPSPTPVVKPDDADESIYVETERGSTVFNMSAGSTASFIEEDEDAATPRNVPSSGNVFKLVRKVNTFSHIK